MISLLDLRSTSSSVEYLVERSRRASVEALRVSDANWDLDNSDDSKE